MRSLYKVDMSAMRARKSGCWNLCSWTGSGGRERRRDAMGVEAVRRRRGGGGGGEGAYTDGEHTVIGRLNTQEGD